MWLLLVLTAMARTIALGDGLLADQWTTAEGLPLDHAKDVAFTADGYTWVATFEGVVRFDGARFAPMPDAWVTALGTRRVAALAVDPRDGGLWVMVEERGVARWRDGELRAWGPEELGGVAKVLVEAPDRTWLITSGGVLRLEDRPIPEPWSVPVGRLAAFAPLPGGRAIVASDEGVAWLQTAGGEPRRLGPAEGVDGWVRTVELGAGGAVSAVIGETLRVWTGERFVPDEAGAACTLRYPSLPRSCAPFGAPASAWRVTTEGIAYDGKTVLRPQGPAEAPVADPRGDVWVPTSADGLLRLRRALVEHLPGGPGDPRVDRVLVDAADRLWARSAGTWSWLLFEPGRRGSGAEGLAVPEAPSWLVEVAPGELLGLQRRTATRGRFEGGALVLEPGRAVPIGPVLDALPTPTGLLLAGDQGLATLVDGLPVPLPTQGAVLSGARALAALDGGAVAVGTRSDGLFVLSGGVAAPVGGQEGLLVQGIRHLRRDGATVWAATEEEGLCAVSPGPAGWGDATWRCLRPGGMVRGVHASLPDGQGRTWLSTNVGLWVGRDDALAAFARGEGPPPALLRLGVEAGMVRAEANGPYGASVARDASGVIWFPTQSGVVGVDPARFTFPEAPRVHLDSEGPVELARGDELPLAWSAPAPAWADQVEYQTRLGDAPWTTTTDRAVTLARLPPGPFTFEVRAGLAGAWGPVAAITGVRRPAWDEGPLAWLGVVALGVLAAAGAVRLRTRSLRRRQAALEREVEERTAEVRAQARALETRTATLAEQAARLAELEELRTRAIVNLHHEIRTPLTLVMGGVSRLARPDDAREGAAHELVLRNAARLEALLGQLGDVARLERGDIVPRTRRLGLAAAAAALVARFAGLAAERGITLRGPEPDRTARSPESEPHVWVDPDIFEKILGNLVHNALKFTPPGGRVGVEVAAAGEHVRVEVRDTGVGVPDHARERVFDRLYQVASGDDRPHEGSGIGLALARELTELSGGQIGHAPNPGGGTVFWFTLPSGSAHVLADDVALPGAGDVAGGSVPEGPTADGAVAATDDTIEGPDGAPLVLVVEDNADMRAWFVEELREGWRVATAVDGEHGLARARALSPALVVSDVMMPRMDGLTLARRLRAEIPTPILLVSAKAGATDREAGLAVADGWLSKPFSSQALRDAVQRLCRGATGPEPRSEADRAFLARLQAAVDARLADPDLDVPALAQAVATSERTLQRELARIAGVSPARWIREHRLRRAEELLRRGERRTVSEVAAAVGMSRAWFTRMYRAWAGRPPGEDLPEG